MVRYTVFRLGFSANTDYPLQLPNRMTLIQVIPGAFNVTIKPQPNSDRLPIPAYGSYQLEPVAGQLIDPTTIILRCTAECIIYVVVGTP